ncbi:hypothetical protein CEE39_06240 [bacterium (candidate division B38) B3_B38]|nr:MAG: hypothetical protein CEE39_06240 [bacterium (candidate division B38) B3_B38]
MVLLKKYIHLLLLLCILIFSFKIRYIEPTSLADLKPYSDAFQYSLSANNLYHHHIYGLKIFGQFYSPKYPYGYPLLIIPFYAIFGSQPYNAVYCSLFFSLLSIVFAYLIGKELGNRFTGLIAALFVSLCPTHISFSKFVMTETSSTFLAIFICWLLLKATHLNLRKQNFLLLLFLGLITGFSVSVHLTNFLFIPPVLISLLLGGKSNPSLIVKKETIVFLGIILALIPLLLYQYYTFGSPLRTGYEVWNPELYGKFKSFSFKFVTHPHHDYKRGNFIAFLFTYTGLENPFYPACMVPLIIGGFLFILSQRRAHNKQMIFLTFSSLVVFLQFVFFSFYAWQGGRHLLQGIPLLMILAAYGITFSFDRGIFKSLTKQALFSIIALILFLMTIIQMALWCNSMPKSSRWIVNRQYEIIQNINRHIPHNAVIISQFTHVIAEHYFTEHRGDKRVYISLSSTKFLTEKVIDHIKLIRYDRAKRYSFLFRPGGALNPRTYNFIRRSLKKGVPVYLVHLPGNPLSKNLLPFIKRYFSLIEQEGDSRLFRLYLKDWK